MTLQTIVINCKIQPKDKSIESQTLLKFTELPEQLEFLLNPDLVIKKCQLKIGDKKFEKIIIKEIEVPDDSFIKLAKKFQVTIPDDIEKTDQKFFYLMIKYSGKIKQSQWDLSYIKDDFVELASYGAWYPILPSLKRHAYELTLTAPKEWVWITNSDLDKTLHKKENLVWYWNDKKLKTDITLIGIPENLQNKTKNSLFWGQENIVQENALYEKHLLECIVSLENWLGSIKTRDRFAYVFTPRETGGQYSRDGLIVTVKKLPTEEELFSRVLQSMVHEVTHFWWNKTSVSDYHNWLDEALAEITSSIVVAEKFEEDDWLENRAQRVLVALEKQGELPSIRKTPRSLKEAYSLFYYRGFLLFYEILKKIGKELFKKILQKFASYIDEIEQVTTDNFLDFLNQFSDEITFDIHKLINTWLDYKGKGIP
jgi:hypothetical protein